MRKPQSGRGTLGLVQLEDRATPAVFTVTTTADNGNDAVPVVGSLRAALIAANSTPGADTINFNIIGTGVQTITPPAPFAPITEAVTIDATTQPGYSSSPVVRISGSTPGAGANGLTLANHSGSTIRGLAIGGFSSAGVLITGGGQHRVELNHLGTNAAGTAADPNGVGIIITDGSTQNFIGGSQDTRNIISGNKSQGIIVGGAAKQNTIAANFIGLGLNGGTPIANGGDGILITDAASFTTVGGTTTGAGNVIASNAGAGIRISGAATAGTLINANRIGLDFGGSASGNGGDGIRVENAAGTSPAGGLIFPDTNTTISGNTIKQNVGAGVSILDTSRYVRVVNNSIQLNGGLGLNVASTANDGLAAPIITKVSADSINAITVNGTVNGRPNTAYDVSLFANTTKDPSGFGEGETKAVTVSVITNAAGTATFTGVIPAGLSAPFVTATATAKIAGDTSAFSESKDRPARGLDGRLAFAAAGSGAPVVNLYDSSGAIAATFSVFDASVTGGVRVAAGDFNLDGVPDVVAGTGPGSITRVRIIDPVTQDELFSIQPFESAFTGGVYVAAGDVTGDGVADLIISPDEGGGPRVRVFNGRNFSLVADFFGIADPNFRGGARTAVGDVNRDGTGDLVVAAGFGGGPRVAVFNGKSITSGTPTTLFNDFFAFEQTLRNGVFIAAGDINDDGFAEVIAGGGPGGGPRILALSGQALLSNQLVTAANFFAGDDTNRGGIRVAARDLNADGSFEVLAGDGPGGTGRLRVYTGSDLTPTTAADPRLDVTAFATAVGGVFVG